MRNAPKLPSFWMAGFEGADHRNSVGKALDMVAITGHDDLLSQDYAALAARGIRAVRESIGWRTCEPEGGGKFDFQRAQRVACAARSHGLQVLWTLMHYGVPPDVSLMDESFCDRFASFAAAATRALAPLLDPGHVPIFTPINEISFLAWAACETNLIYPHVGNRADPRHVPLQDGYEVKRRLVRATLMAMTAIHSELPSARFLHVDPLVHVVAPKGATAELVAEAHRFREFQWQAWDLLSGRLEPGLGGHPEALDLIGINHYPTAQWEFASGRTLDWGANAPPEPRRLALSDLLMEAWQRYRRPLLIAETGHCDDDRAAWMSEVAREATVARDCGIHLFGICLYPIVDRPDWEDVADWHRCGLWDATEGSDRIPENSPGRFLCRSLDTALRQSIGDLASAHVPILTLQDHYK